MTIPLRSLSKPTKSPFPPQTEKSSSTFLYFYTRIDQKGNPQARRFLVFFSSVKSNSLRLRFTFDRI
ncbi:hypothetical protein V6N11_029873 [Hibiscus sabdariffa]|uniref:Uncharacterized protein n=1 Tax=Hibiscus sabdariffa TaxID=183260 RepID=A0ABR2PJ64_9ROSI